MYKLSPDDREKARKKKARQRARQTEKEKEAERQASREYHTKNHGKRNAGCRTRAHRRELKSQRGSHERFAGLSIVSLLEIERDDTRWKGPAEAQESRLEKIATEILKQAPPDDPPICATAGDPIQRAHPEIRTPQSAEGPAKAGKRELWPTGKERPTWA